MHLPTLSRRGSMIGVLPMFLLFTHASVASVSAQGVTPRWTAVDSTFGRRGSPQPGGVMKWSFPRSDLSIVMEGVTVRPALALGGWVALKDAGHGQSMAMGDLVLTPDEVNDVIRALQEGGVEQTALHNHLLAPVMYMHIAAHGDPAKIAAAIRRALATTKTPLGPPGAPAPASAADLDTAGIARALGHAGKLNGVVYQVSVPRRERVMDGGHKVPPSMGVATAINFQPTGGGKAAITGDFVLLASEVNPVIRSLEAHGIKVEAVHSHMLFESPRLFFLHYWANDDAVTLATGLRAALDLTASAKASAR